MRPGVCLLDTIRAGGPKAVTLLDIRDERRPLPYRSATPWFDHRRWEDLSREEQDNILGWVELVSTAQIEAYGSALKLAGLDVDDD